MEEKRRGREDDYVQTILFTAGTVLVMACIKQSVAVSLMEQYWRAWVFVLLNLVLLAIAFTSLRSTSPSKNQEEQSITETKELKRRDNKQCSTASAEAEQKEECYGKFYDKASFDSEEEKRVVVDEGMSTWKSKSQVENNVAEENNQEMPRSMSPEELNERVEAFITMFRQQLVKDARKGREHVSHRPEVTERFNFHRVTYSCNNPDSFSRSRRVSCRKVM